MKDNARKYTFDDKGNAILSIPMSNVPAKQWEQWNSICNEYYNGQRWQMVWCDHIKAQAYDNMVMAMGHREEYNIDPDVGLHREDKQQDDIGIMCDGSQCSYQGEKDLEMKEDE